MTSEDRKNEYFLPPYPALQSGIIIDARHSSRTDIVKDLKTIALFTHVLEGQSLKDAMSGLEMQDIDVCFLGPSVTIEKAVQFIKRAKERARSKDCAFIAIVNRGDDNAESAETKLLDAGAHGVVKRPCSKLLLSDWIVRAVVKANGSGAWAKMFLESGHHAAEINDNFAFAKPGLGVLGSAAVSKQDSGSGAPGARDSFWLNVPKTPLENALFAALKEAMGKSPSLQEIISGVESGTYRLDPTGMLTVRTREGIRAIVNHIIPERLASDGESSDFRRYFEMSLENWVKDLINEDTKIATANFRQALLTYKR